MFKLDPFWYTFHDPFLTTLVIGLAIIIPCYLVYLCIILLIIKYKKRKRIRRAGHNAVNIKCNKVINEVKSRTLETNSVKSKEGDVLIPASTTTTGIDLANATAVLENDILLGGDINILRPKKSVNPVFMAHLLTHFKKHDIARKAQGITIIHVYGRDLANITVRLPNSIEEQQKIVAVLTNADREIELLEQQLANLQKEKKALMQQLLTGKKRVLVDV